MRFILCTCFGEFCSCCSLTALPGPAWVLLNWIWKELISSLYVESWQGNGCVNSCATGVLCGCSCKWCNLGLALSQLNAGNGRNFWFNMRKRTSYAMRWGPSSCGSTESPPWCHSSGPWIFPVLAEQRWDRAPSRFEKVNFVSSFRRTCASSRSRSWTASGICGPRWRWGTVSPSPRPPINCRNETIFTDECEIHLIP